MTVTPPEPFTEPPPGPTWPPGQEPKVSHSYPPLERIPPNRRPPYAGIPLRKGATGAPVRQLQRLLGVPLTDTFDNATAAALRAFQAEVGAPPSGVVVPRLWSILWDRKVLGGSKTWTPAPPKPTTPAPPTPKGGPRV